LLETIKTGGLAAAQLRIQQAFGVEGADEGELSANLGKAVLSQLRDTFGAAFTEKESAKLERIEAGFGKSSATNKRLLRNLLQIVEKRADNAIQAAVDAKDFRTAAEIQDALGFELEPLEEPAQAAPATAAPLFSGALNREITEQAITDTLAQEPGLTREALLQQLQVQ
jgi:hypothetical protein